jgi:hypothetical protein
MFGDVGSWTVRAVVTDLAGSASEPTLRDRLCSIAAAAGGTDVQAEVSEDDTELEITFALVGQRAAVDEIAYAVLKGVGEDCLYNVSVSGIFVK